MFIRTFTAGLVLGSAALAPPVHAQAACNTRDVVVERLEGKYSEVVAARGLQSAQQMIEVFASPETGSFTVVLSRPDGVSCIIASGNHWHSVPAVMSDDSVAG